MLLLLSNLPLKDLILRFAVDIIKEAALLLQIITYPKGHWIPE